MKFQLFLVILVALVGLSDGRPWDPPEFCASAAKMDASDLLVKIRNELAPENAGNSLVVLKRGWDGLPLTIGDPNRPDSGISFDTLIKKMIQNSCKNCSNHGPRISCPPQNSCPPTDCPESELTTIKYKDFEFSTTNRTLSYVVAVLSLVCFVLSCVVSKPMVVSVWKKIRTPKPYRNIPGTLGTNTPNSNNPRHRYFFQKSNSMSTSSSITATTNISNPTLIHLGNNNTGPTQFNSPNPFAETSGQTSAQIHNKNPFIDLPTDSGDGNN
jgi:hypothetical protein